MAYKVSIPRQDIAVSSSGNTRSGVKMLNHFNVQVYIKEKITIIIYYIFLPISQIHLALIRQIHYKKQQDPLVTLFHIE
jgi:hypothetical protein